jgi:hypothetical protein
MPLFLFCTVCCLSKSYAHTNNCKNKITCSEKKTKKRKRKNRKENQGERKIGSGSQMGA